MPVNRVFKIILVLVSMALGLVFLYSAYAKLFPVIEPFEFSFVETGMGNWYLAPIEARLLIGLEAFLGLMLIINYRLKQFTIPFTAAVLLFFIMYLIIQIAVSGNQGNCGCFGEHLRMTPLQAIVKNLFMLLLGTLIYFFHGGWSLKRNKLFLLGAAAVCLIFPFVLNPVDYTYSSNNLQEKVNYPLELDLLYHPEDTTKVEVPALELRTGKQVVAFLSLSCPHCRIAAKKFRLIKRNNPQIPIYFVLNGSREKYAEFLAETKANNIPSSFCLGRSFVQLASAQLPRIYFLDNGLVVKKVDYLELNQYDLEEWLFGKP